MLDVIPTILWAYHPTLLDRFLAPPDGDNYVFEWERTSTMRDEDSVDVHIARWGTRICVSLIRFRSIVEWLTDS